MVVSHDDTQDILQDTFLKIYRHLWTLRKPEALRGWIYRIAGREALRFLERKSRQLGTAGLEPDLYVEAADLYDYDIVLQIMD